MKKLIAFILIIISVFALSACGTTEKPSATVTPSKVVLDKTSASVFVGKTAKLTATVEPLSASDKSVKFTSSDVKIASVDDEGVVTGVAVGSCTITATTVNGKTATCKVAVSKLYDIWDGKIPEKQPETLKIAPNKEVITFMGGEKGEADVIFISKVEELVYFLQKMTVEDLSSSKYVIVKLLSDFDLNNKEWAPAKFIRNQDGNGFYMFDGNGKEIRGLLSTGASAGLFEAVSNSTFEIRDLIMKNATCTASGDYAAAVNAASSGEVTYNNVCVTDSKISSKKYAGGISAYGRGTFNKCEVKSVGVFSSPTSDTLSVGGLMAVNNGGVIADCYLEKVYVTGERKNLTNCNVNVGALFGIAQSDVSFSGKTSLKKCEVNNEELLLNSQLIFSDNRADRSYAKVEIVKEA